MDTAQWTSMSRRDLQEMQMQGIRGESVVHEYGNGDNADNDDSGEFDDFSLHDLRDLRIPQRSPIVNGDDMDLMSNASSSAASTVIHNPNLKSDDDVEHLQSHVMQTLESDPDLHIKLHRTLKIAEVNNSQQRQYSVEDDETTTTTTTTNDSKVDTVDETLDDANDTVNDIIDGIGYTPDQEHEEQHDYDYNGSLTNNDNNSEQNSSTDSLNMVEDMTDDKLSDFIDGMMPSPPSSPPRELDPSKLYALFDFTGPDPSHLPLSKNDSVHLLNDSDSYWWLVKRDDNNRIGFAPAEILETYSERLARLNCWKNEVLERGGYKGLRHEDERKLFKTEHPPPSLSNMLSRESVSSLNNDKANSSTLERKGSLKKPKFDSTDDFFDQNKKTVSFADLNEIQEHSVLSESDSINNDMDNSIDASHNSSLSLLDNYDVDTNDVVSDVEVNPSTSKPVTNQLIMPKKRKNFLIKNLDTYQPSITDENRPDSESPLSSANDDFNSLISTPTKDHEQEHNITVSTCGSNESVDRIATLQPLNVKKIRKYPDNNKTTSSPMPQRQHVGEVQEHRLASLQMLDDLLEMYPEFAPIGDTSAQQSQENSPQKQQQQLGEGYRSNRDNLQDKLIQAGSVSPSPPQSATTEVKDTKDDTLHPSTQRIFTPLFSHMEKLDQMVNELQNL